MKKATLLVFIFLGVLRSTSIQSQAEKKSLNANRIEEGQKIKIDGHIDEPIWLTSEIASNFVQTDPVFRDPVSQKTEVRILYSNRGIYIGAMLYDTEPDKILKELSPRDRRGNTDFFGVAFDTYRDGLNGFAFNVTASGVQQDIKIAGGREDSNWDGIWESEVQFLDNGWSVEMFIPYLSLRFANKDVQEWNIQFLREIRRFRENVYWNPVDPALDGFVNQFGHLDGIKDIKSPIRLSVTPFVTGYANINSYPNSNQETEVTPAYTGGMDLKYGINDAFTLDMTLVPDFGQVISDNQVLNLSPFEVRFDENRQFFKEGTELFDKGNLFYTRRVGGRPINYLNGFVEANANESVIENPDQAQLINATKISGRTSRGTGLGIFNAIEGQEFAILQDAITGTTREVETNPYTNYNVLVADQNLPNNSVVSLINTNVTRFGDTYNANTTGVFLNLKNKAQTYAVDGQFTLANQFFEQGTNTGHKFSIGGAKIGGNWRGELNYLEESDDYNPNDLGILFSPNERDISGEISYNDYKPSNDKLQRWEVGISQNYSRLYRPNVFVNYGIGINSFVLWKSRNALGFNARYEPTESKDYFEPRTSDFSKFYNFPKSWLVSSFFSSDYRKKFALDVRVFYRDFNEPGRVFSTFRFAPRVRFNDQFSFIFESVYTLNTNDVGYTSSTFDSFTIPGIEDQDVMFGTRDRNILENSLNTQYIFNDKMSLTARVRHYWDQVEYNAFNRLEEDGSLSKLDFDGTIDGEAFYDRNVNIFNIDLQYTWRFAKGSDIIFVWKNQIIGTDRELQSDYFQNLGNLFDFNQLNSLSLKIVYFLDYDTVFNG